MATIEQTVGQDARNALGSKFSLPSLAPGASQPKTRDEISNLARQLAYSVVTGYLEHDRGRLDKSVEGFFQVYLHLFTKVSPLRARRAAELYVDALVKQDEIENFPDHSREQIANDPMWDEVRRILLELSRTLGIPDSYADETTGFFRYHGVRDSRYMIHCLASEDLFMTEAIGNNYWSKILGSLLLLLTECHDKHDSTGLETGIEFATKYYEIILRAKAAVAQKAPTIST